MATGVTVKEQLPGILSVSPSRVDRQLRFLTADGLIPAGKQGGRSGAVHFTSLHLAYILMAQAAPTPAEAPNAVRTLRAMPYRGMSNPPEDVGLPLPTFEKYLAHMIEGYGAARLNNAAWFPDSLGKILNVTVQLCLLPAHAIFKLPSSAGNEATAVYAGDATPQPTLRHLTVIYGPALLACAEMWADSEIQRNAQEALARLRETPAKAPSESNNAGSLRQEVLPASSFDDQPLAKGTSALTSAEGIWGDQGIQACGVARAGHQTELTLV